MPEFLKDQTTWGLITMFIGLAILLLAIRVYTQAKAKALAAIESEGSKPFDTVKAEIEFAADNEWREMMRRKYEARIVRETAAEIHRHCTNRIPFNIETIEGVRTYDFRGILAADDSDGTIQANLLTVAKQASEMLGATVRLVYNGHMFIALLSFPPEGEPGAVFDPDMNK